MINKKDKIITLKNGKEYIIIDQCLYNNDYYYFACELKEQKQTENYKILNIYKENDKQRVKIIEDDQTIKVVCSIIEKQYI